MFDSTVFFSTYVAVVAAFITMETFSFILGLYLARKQIQRQEAFMQEFTKSAAEGTLSPGVNPMQMMMMGGGMPMAPAPTVSGETKKPEVFGQYA